jgi:hypothetical protein
MLRIDLGKSHRDVFCDRVTRRQAIWLGGSGLIAGLSLPSLLQLEAQAAAPQPAKARSCIFIFLRGGPSTIDMWDLKPDAPAEIRGPYKPVATAVPGISIGERLPLCAKVTDKFAIVRSHSHNDNGHMTGYHLVMTGYKADFPDGDSRIPNNALYPSAGSIVCRELGQPGAMPAYINMPTMMMSGGAGFYGVEYAPFVIESDPVQADFEVKDLRLTAGTNSERLNRQRRLLAGIERLQRERPAQDRAGVMSTYYEKAYDLITSPQAKKAFDLNSEPDSVRAAYGYTSLGQCALLARRLVEAGCRFIGIDHGFWDTHFDCFPTLEKDLFPHFDQAFSALLTQLAEKGLLDSTLVVAMGEMGRTPRISSRAGRDHWSQAQSILLAGGGVKPGQIIGATDKQCAYPTTEPVSVEDVLRTVFSLMGIDTTKTYYTPLGRPVPIVNGGRIIKGLV